MQYSMRLFYFLAFFFVYYAFNLFLICFLMKNFFHNKISSVSAFKMLLQVHCISASAEAHIWQHLLLLIQCPFLALSATIGNPDALHKWLEVTENSKSKRERKVFVFDL